jgi:cation diffusion facilitator family transporter
VVIANAWHHRSDAYSSILALGSIGVAMYVPGMAAADAFAGLLVAGMICMTGAEIMGEAVNQLTDKSDKQLIERLKTVALEESDDVLEIDRIRARQMGSSAIVDLSIMTPANFSPTANKEIENRVRYAIMDKEKGILDAEVRATSQSLVQFPPLTATGAQHGNNTSIQQIESDARSLLMSHDEVSAVNYIYF